MARGRTAVSLRCGWRALAVAVLVLGADPASGTPAAGPTPAAWPWERTYVEEIALSTEDLEREVVAGCLMDGWGDIFDNHATGKPVYGVIGDSVPNQARPASMLDPDHHWVYGTHCGENWITSLGSGRVAKVLAHDPDVLVLGFGTNNAGAYWGPSLDRLPEAEANLELLLAATDDVPCRVIFNVPEKLPDHGSAADLAAWAVIERTLNRYVAAIDTGRHRGIIQVDWNAITTANPSLLGDAEHMTRAGINARINLTLAASRRCFRPDTPSPPRAVPGNTTATVSWDPLPAEEAVTRWHVTSSRGFDTVTDTTTITVPGLLNDEPVSFQVQAYNGAGWSDVSLPSGAVVPSASGARFHATTPRRVLDTRDGTGGRSGALGPGDQVSFDATGPLGPAAVDASAVVLNVTAVGATEPTFLTAWPGRQARPSTSSLNPGPGEGPVAAMVTTAVDSAGTVEVFNNSGRVDVVADVVGWYGPPGGSSGSLFTATAPRRVLDTRVGTGGRARPLGPGETRRLALDDLPAGATAAVVNITGTGTTQPTFVTVHPGGSPRPVASMLNPRPGVTRANLTVGAVSPAGELDIYNSAGSTDLVADLVGWFGPDGDATGGAEYFPVRPVRLVDTRDGTGGLDGPMANVAPASLSLAGAGGLPAGWGMSAVDANVTMVAPSAGGFLAVWPTGARPESSLLNFRAGEVVANRDFAAVARDGSVLVWATAPTAHVVVDVAGWFGPVLGATPRRPSARDPGP